jgi:polar amino acid transport system substrate-binding protein
VRRFAWLAVIAAVVGAILAAGSFRAPQGRAASQPTAGDPKLPPLPAAVKARKRWVIGVKCDFRPFGYIDAHGHHAGYDVEVAQQFAKLAFGSTRRVHYVCVTTQTRIPELESHHVDILIATLTWTKARAQQIDYSVPYYGATGQLLVRRDAGIHGLADLNGKAVVTTHGSIYATWLKTCAPQLNVSEVTGTAEAVQALKEHRASAFVFDDAFLLGAESTDPGLALTTDKFLELPWGIGIRKGDSAMRAWANAALQQMKRTDQFFGILRHNVPRSALATFADQVPRPHNSLAYPIHKDPATDCSVRR